MGRPTSKSRKGPSQMRHFMRWGSVLAGFLIVNFVLRMALIAINQAEYTDGVLQVMQFSEPTGIWPPMYTALTWVPAWLLGPMWAGRLVSTLASTLALIPLFLLARRSFGFQAAVFTALVYTVAPVPLRWSPRMMTDATFSLFFWFCCERLILAQSAKDAQASNSALIQATVFGTLAALTRYQGLLLMAPVVAVAVYHWRAWGFVPWKGLGALALYGLVPAWSIWRGNIHGEQFAERSGDNIVMTAWMNAEAFFLMLPYFLTYPVAAAAVIGMTRGRARPRRGLKPLTVYTLLVLLLAHGAFGSFQERYMLPAMGLLFVWAGVGLAATDNILRKSRINFHHRMRPYFPLLVVVWSAMISVLVLMGSREAFGDIAAGARLAAASTPADRTVYTNEIYRDGDPPIAANKVAFFARRSAAYIEHDYYTGARRMQPGDTLVLSSIFLSDDQMVMLERIYDLEELSPAPRGFASSVTPVFPDLMAMPGTAQNPTAWVYRYIPQPFFTRVYRVVRVRVTARMS